MLQSVLAVLLVFSAIGQAAAASGTAQTFLLEIWINGRSRHVIATVVERDGTFWLDKADLIQAGVKLGPHDANADGLVALGTLKGVHAALADAEQRLLITAGNERLVPQAFDLSPENYAGPATAGTGFIGQYDVAATVDDFAHAAGTAGIGATVGGTFFTPLGTLSANGFAQTGSGPSHLTRLDTAAEFDQQDSLRSWLVGDTISGGLSWSRSVRFAGLQVATDFSLRPDLATLPLPSFFGQTAVPATVDVFVNAARVFETELEPGPFQIDNLPVLTGAGEASIVVRDVLGQETTAVLPFFATNALLRQGLSAYDFDIGALRQDYGLRSFAYGDAAAAGTYRYGATNWLTLETHAEATRDVQLMGAGAVFSLGPYGVMQAAAAASNSLRHLGALYTVSLDTQSRPVALFGSASATSGAYEDLATIGGTAPPRLQIQLGGNLSLARYGSLAASWIQIRRDGQAMTRLASTSYTLSFADRWYLGATSFYDYVNRVWTAEAFLSLSFGHDLIAHASEHAGTNSSEQEIGLTKSVNPDGGFGYRVLASTGDNNIEQAEATWIEPHGSLDAAVSSVDDRVAGRILASGAVVAMDGSVYATQVPDGAIALVRTGQENVRIFRENRQVATADSDGEALLTGLVPYTANRLSIDPRDYNFATTVDTTNETVVPRRMSGVIVDLAPKSHRPVIIALRLKNGAPPPIGAIVTLSRGDEPLVVGRDGEVFVADMPGPLNGTVEYAGGPCRFEVAPPAVAPKDSIPRIGPVLCLEAVAK